MFGLGPIDLTFVFLTVAFAFILAQVHEIRKLRIFPPSCPTAGRILSPSTALRRGDTTSVR